MIEKSAVILDIFMNLEEVRLHENIHLFTTIIVLISNTYSLFL